MTLYTATEISFASVFGVVLICMIEYLWNTLAYSFAVLKIELNVWQPTETTRMFIEFFVCLFVCLFVWNTGKIKKLQVTLQGEGRCRLKPKQNQFIEAKTKPIIVVEKRMVKEKYISLYVIE